MLKADNAHDLALLYHLNSEPWLNFAAYHEPPGEIARRPVSGTAVPLPPARPSPLGSLLDQRCSNRRYRGTEMSIGSLASVLRAGYGAGALFRSADGRRVCSRPVPSAGGYYPVSLFAVTTAVTGLPDGLHCYDPWQHELVTLRSGPVRVEADRCLLAPQFLQGANVLLFLAAALDPMLAKYGPRGYRYLLLEAGHIAQNCCLAAIEQQLATLCVGGFFDRAVATLLGLKEVSEMPLYCIGIGHPDDAGAGSLGQDWQVAPEQ
jgi:SagB-type dehydrogenase family enzyme